MNAFSLGLGEAEAERVDGQRGDAEQLHRRADQAGCNHVVDEERTVVREEDAPGTDGNGERKCRTPTRSYSG